MEHKRLRIHLPDWLKAIALVVALFVVYIFTSIIIDTIVIFLVASILAYVMHPFVNWLMKRGLSRGISVVIIFIVALFLLVISFYLIIPPFIDQLTAFVVDLPKMLDRMQIGYSALRGALPGFISNLLPPSIDTLSENAIDYISSQSARIVGFLPSVFAAVAGFALMIIFALYILLFIEEIDGWFRMWIPDAYHWLYDRFVSYLDVGYGRYIVGQIIVSVTYGLAVGIVAAIFGLPFPALLGIWAGVIQIIPIIGPFIAVILPIVFAFIESLQTGIIVTVVLLVITAAQGVFITPYILGATVVISPLVVLFFIVAGGNVGGVGGTILAVPFLVFLNLVWQFVKENFYYRAAAPPPHPPTIIEAHPETPPEEPEF